MLDSSLGDDFRVNLKILQTITNKTSREVAVGVGVHEQTVCNWRAGRRFPSRGSINRLCEFFKIDQSTLGYVPDREEMVELESGTTGEST